MERVFSCSARAFSGVEDVGKNKLMVIQNQSKPIK
jgi:hypothetical protein